MSLTATIPRFPFGSALLFGVLAHADAGCCIDYQQQQNSPPDRDTAVGWDTSDSGEVCDGVDNDDDGIVDEGHADEDGDGNADCVDSECIVGTESAEAVSDISQCSMDLTAADAAWSIEVMWESEYNSGGCFWGVAVADLDADGHSDVICSGIDESTVYSGVDGSLLWTTRVLANHSPLVVGDPDGDGTWDVLAFDRNGHLVSLTSDGTVSWTGDAEVVDVGGGYLVSPGNITLADLFADGSAEVVGATTTSSALSGNLVDLHQETALAGITVASMLVADLDMAGQQEIVSSVFAYRADGSLWWEQEVDWATNEAVLPHLVQADEDEQAEIVFVYPDGAMTVTDHHGVPISQSAVEDMGDTVGVGCAGDLDGDGEMELVVTGSTKVLARELNGAVLWHKAIYDPNTYVGCSVFDFDLDGAKDVLLGDQEDFYILDGRTGGVRFHDPSRESLTVGDTPMVADLDGDGSVEIIVPSYCGICDQDVSIRVYRNTNRDWPPGSPIWPSYNWSGTSLFLDGSIPRTPDPSWLTTKVWRGQPEAMLSGWDLRPEIASSCASSCDPEVGRVTLGLRLVNLGPQEVQRGAPVAVYGLEQDGTLSLLEVLWFHEFIDNRWASATVELELELEQAIRGIVLQAGDDGSGTVVMEDCDQGNNELMWRLDACD